MNSHDVRQLTVCDVCDGLLNKKDVIKGYGAAICEVCAIRRAGGLDAFTKMYPPSEWKKLTLGTVGSSGMRKLLGMLAKIG
jgi:hypothetical protein